jgi:hypothetical protein
LEHIMNTIDVQVVLYPNPVRPRRNGMQVRKLKRPYRWLFEWDASVHGRTDFRNGPHHSEARSVLGYIRANSIRFPLTSLLSNVQLDPLAERQQHPHKR